MIPQSSRARRLSDRRNRPTKSLVGSHSATTSVAAVPSVAPDLWRPAVKEVTKTRSRLEGKRGTFRWTIYVDAPGGHGAGHGAKFKLVKGLELREIQEQTFSKPSKSKTKGKSYPSGKTRTTATRNKKKPPTIKDQAVMSQDEALKLIPEKYLQTPCDLDSSSSSHSTSKESGKGPVQTSFISQDDTLIDSGTIPETSIDGSQFTKVLRSNTNDEDSASSASASEWKKEQTYIMEPTKSSHNRVDKPRTSASDGGARKRSTMQDSFADYMHQSFTVDSDSSEVSMDDEDPPFDHLPVKGMKDRLEIVSEDKMEGIQAAEEPPAEMSFSVENLLDLSTTLDTTPQHDQRAPSSLQKKHFKGTRRDSRGQRRRSSGNDRDELPLTVMESPDEVVAQGSSERKSRSSHYNKASKASKNVEAKQHASAERQKSGDAVQRSKPLRRSKSDIHADKSNTISTSAREATEWQSSHSHRNSRAQLSNHNSAHSLSSSETSSVWLHNNHQSFVAKNTLMNPYQVPDLIMDRSVTAQFMQLNLENDGGVKEVDNDEVESVVDESKESTEVSTDREESLSRRDALPRIPTRQKSTDFGDDLLCINHSQEGDTKEGNESESLEKRNRMSSLRRSKSATGAAAASKAPRKKNKSMDRSKSRFKQFLAFANASFSSHGEGGQMLSDDDDESLGL